jgi:hypothetical protein
MTGNAGVNPVVKANFTWQISELTMVQFHQLLVACVGSIPTLRHGVGLVQIQLPCDPISTSYEPTNKQRH